MSRTRAPWSAWRVGGSPVLVVLGVAAIVAALAVAMQRFSYDVWGAFWVGPLLFGLTVPIARHMAKVERDPRVGRLVLLAFFAKVVVGTVARYVTVNGVYGNGDSKGYSDAGKLLAPLFRHGDYSNLGKVSGTRFVTILTGQVYALIGPTELGAYLVYSFFGFVGLVLLVRAFRIAVPDGDHGRYRLLVFFFPTMLFWPSSIGKDAWMLLCIGLAAYGIARALTGRLWGAVPLGLGLWGASVVRPHIALLLVVAGAAAVLVRFAAPAQSGGGRVHRLRSVLLAVVLLVGIVALTNRAESFFHLNSLDPESATSVLTEVNQRTGQGGSQFTAPSATTPWGYARALVTVLFRPFPGEGHGALGLVASGEGVLFLLAVFGSIRRLARLPSQARRDPYVLAALAYLLGFVYAFSSINNFGILARERAQVLPFAFVLLSLPSLRPPPPRHRATLDRRADAPVGERPMAPSGNG